MFVCQNGLMKNSYPFNQYQELSVWKDAHAWVLDLFQVSTQLPEAEQFTLKDLIIRRSISIPLDIAESTHVRNKKESTKLLFQAKAGVEVVKYYLLISKDLKFISDKEYQALFESGESISKQISGWIKAKYKKVNQDSAGTTE